MATKKRVPEPTEERPAMSFFQQLAETAQPYRKPVYGVSKDPMTVMRNKFYDGILTQIAALEQGEKETRWYSIEDDGSVIITFRNGNKIMSVDGNTHFKVESTEKAREVFQAAADGVARGEFNELLKETKTQRKRKTQGEV